jgi:hypothetical protein
MSLCFHSQPRFLSILSIRLASRALASLPGILCFCYIIKVVAILGG